LRSVGRNSKACTSSLRAVEICECVILICKDTMLIYPRQ
jgi:hypothetical protein